MFITEFSTAEGEGGVRWSGGRVSFSQAGGPREMEDSISSAQSSTGAGGLLAVCRSSLGGRGPLSMAQGGEEGREGPGGDIAPSNWRRGENFTFLTLRLSLFLGPALGGLA